MTNYEMDAEPGRYEFEGTPVGMSALVAAWHHRRVVAAEGHAIGRTVVSGQAEVVRAREDVAVTLGEWGLAVKGQQPGAEGQLIEAVALAHQGAGPRPGLPPSTEVAQGRGADRQRVHARGVPRSS